MTRSTLLSFVGLTILAACARASPCIVMDSNWNLLALGFGGKDYNAGTQDAWSSGNAADITTSGRPPFDGSNTTCFLSQFANAIYVLRGDTSNPNAVHIYDATAKSWSTQATDAGSFDLQSSFSILDHDTNVFYSIAKGELWSLNMGDLKAANSSSIAWVDQKAVGFNTTGWNPVGALASNHIHYLNVPGVAAGSAEIFVIHFSYFQPEVQKYGDFPATNGQAFSVFKDQGVQEEFAFIPDDGSATFVVNVMSNTTRNLPGPSTKDAGAMYFGSPSGLVQLSPSNGGVSFFAYSANNADASKSGSWSEVSSLKGKFAVASSPSSTAPGGSSNTRAGVPTGAAQGSASNSDSGNGNAALSVVARTPSVTLAAALVGVFALL